MKLTNDERAQIRYADVIVLVESGERFLLVGEELCERIVATGKAKKDARVFTFTTEDKKEAEDFAFEVGRLRKLRGL